RLLKILAHRLPESVETLLQRIQLLLQHQSALIRLICSRPLANQDEQNGHDAEQRDAEENVKQRTHPFVMSSGVETSLDISETVRDSSTSRGMTSGTKTAPSFRRNTPFRAPENRKPPRNVRR